MAKNRNKKKKNGAVSMDTTDSIVSEAPQAMDTSESVAKIKVAGATKLKVKQNGRPMKRSKCARKMKAIAKAISANEKSAQKVSKNDSKKVRVQSAKTLYE
ncbi:unnamed protein product [Lathyrus oleraceus]|uniref:Uncharacterized protein n=1 Tax=Pisum sativum TaxID=3888 RepID=A0A9D4X1R7_PEA|nr:uncharacterized protein LOC127086405 [Pisum sativum]KAI5412023.1 hypothetical protein KIW84_056917 [Pisum sativum]